MENPDILSGANAAATYLGFSRRQVYHLVTAGHLPALKLGARLYFRKSQLDAALSCKPAC